jgi:polysaccharide biosynthesis transport protein
MPLESAAHPTHPLSPQGNGSAATAETAAPRPELSFEPSLPPPALSAPPSMENLLAVFRQHWASMLLFGVVAALLAAAVGWFVTPGKFTASAYIQLPKVKGVSDGESEMVNFQKASAALVKSTALLDKVVADPEIAGLNEIRQYGDPSAALARELTTDNIQLGADMIRINLSGDYPEDLAVIVNKILQVYNKEFEAREQARTRARREQLMDKYKNFSDDLRRFRMELQTREKAQNVEDSGSLVLRQQAVMSQLTGLETTRAQLRQETIKSLTSLTNAEAHYKSGAVQISSIAIDREARLDPSYTKRLEDLSEREKQISAIRNKLRPGTVDQDLTRLESLQDSSRAAMTEIRQNTEKGMREKALEDLKESIARGKESIEVIKKQEKDLDDQILVKYGELLKLKSNPAVEQGVAEKRDEVERTLLMLKRLGEEMGTLEAEAALAARVTVLDTAVPPTARRIDRKIRVASLAGFSLFGIMALGVALVEFGKRRVYRPEDVSRGLGLKMLGTLPTLSPQARKSTFDPSKAEPGPDQLPMLEAVDALRTVLLYAARNQQFRTIMVTSPQVGEGKTSLACQLASSLARSGRRTLLLDLDLRNPSAHTHFDVPQGPGVSEALRGEAVLDKVLYPTGLEGLSVLPAGHADRLAIQALGREELAELLTTLQKDFDFIVIDTSPVLPVADTIQIGQHVDAVLLTVLRGVSRLPALYAAQQRLSALGIRILGAVLTGDTTEGYGIVRTGRLGL